MIRIGLTLMPAVAAVGAAVAQPKDGQPPQTQPPAARQPLITATLSDEPFRLDSVGLMMRLPAGASAQSAKVNQQTTVQVAPEDRSWVINIQLPRDPDSKSTVTQMADRIIQQFIDDSPIKDAKSGETIGTRIKLESRTPNLKIPGSKEPAERFYLTIPRADKSVLLQGFTIFKPAPDQFVIFELVTSEANAARAKALYELTVATVSFQDSSTLEASRRAAVIAGISFLEKLGPDDYIKAMPAGQQWYRIYRPAPSGSPGDAEEVGYRSVRFWKGHRADIPGLRGGGDNPEGVLVEIAARVLDRHPINNSVRTIDTTGTYFQTLDRREEEWSVKTAVRDPRGRQPAIWSETGVRHDRDVQVAVSQSGQEARAISPVIQGDGFITQFEVFLLPRLVIASGTEAELGFYAYRSDSGTFAMRRETISRDAASGTWNVLTKFREEAEPQKAVYKPNGDLLRSESADGKVTEPVEAEALMRLWKNKNLPTGPIGAK